MTRENRSGNDTCLVLEGGALRGVYTSGVQGVLHRAGLSFDCLIGTSAGAMNGINFLSGQPERSFFIDRHYCRDKNFMGLRPLLREGQIFSFTYMYGPVNDRFPLDLKAFGKNPTRFIAVASEATEGEACYLESPPCSDMLLALRASSSMPLLSTPMELDGRYYYDGGPSMPVAYERALAEGYQRVVLILTRQKGYRKSPYGRVSRAAIRRKFRSSPAFIDMMLSSPSRYNQIMDEIDALEEEGKLFVFRPSLPVTVSRTETDVGKLQNLFQLGRADAMARLSDLEAFLKGEETP